MTTITISWQAALDIPVSDDRGTVPGATVTLADRAGPIVTGDIIPPEGDSIDCWAGQVAWHAFTDEPDVVGALAIAACEGAEGRDGSVEVVV